jgi:fructose-bisphosphate aldolase class I
MNIQLLTNTAKHLVAGDKGLLAMDESNSTCNKRFGILGIPQTEDARRAWRELILTTPKLGNYISGVILYDETIRQRSKDGTSFIKLIVDAGILLGIKVDAGIVDLEGHPGEKITQGLDGLRERLTEYVKMGASFAKWRAVFTIGNGIPSRGCIEANAQALARYASLCQEAGLVPIVEPEILMQGDHTLERCKEVTEYVLREVMIKLYIQGVALEGLILKPSMVLSGARCKKQATLEEIVDATVECLLKTIPAAIPAIAFLSGGQTGNSASYRLNAMNVRFKSFLPWPLSFSFARAIQNPALEIWSGHELNVIPSQHALLTRVAGNQAARRGLFTDEMRMDVVEIPPSNIVTSDIDGYSNPLKSGPRPKFVFGNWKMHGNEVEDENLAIAIVDGSTKNSNIIAAIFPPFPYLAVVAEAIKSSSILLGAQNLYPEMNGAYTGEVSPRMLIDMGCSFVILGHSERRQILGETDQFINKKVRVALGEGLQVVLCVGETLKQRENNQTESILDHQLLQGLEGLSAKSIYRLMIAYEPIWAIGSQGLQATPQQAEREQNFIRYRIGQMFGEQIAESVIILYGGSVNPENASELFNTKGLDGVLIGADSLNAAQFLAIIQAGVNASTVIQ